MNCKIDSGRYEGSNPHLLHATEYPFLVFDDAVSVLSDEGLVRKREMVIEGKRFQIQFFFPFEPVATPTAKLIHLIDSGYGETRK